MSPAKLLNVSNQNDEHLRDLDFEKIFCWIIKKMHIKKSFRMKTIL